MSLTGGPYHALGPRNKQELRARLVRLAFGSVNAAAAEAGVDPTLIFHMIAGRRPGLRAEPIIRSRIRRRLGAEYEKLWAG